MKKENKRVLLGMSGGTDSSVAALLLQDSGYEVTGITFRFYEYNDNLQYLEDARSLAERLGIPHIIYDARDVFRNSVIDYFVDEYMSGRTPVPCTVCNNRLKWPLLTKIADEMGIYYISSGHYARKSLIDGTYYLAHAMDADKDQTFFLWGLNQDTLMRVLLPMGDITKRNARVLASERGMPDFLQKKESLGVCFCPMNYHDFLRKEVSMSEGKAIGQYKFPGRGRFVDENGDFIAWHEGYPFYTIGQRRGLGIDLNRAVFVKEIHTEKNEVVLSSWSSLEKRELFLKDWNIIDTKRLLGNKDIIVKIRYRKQANRCVVTQVGDELLHVKLLEPLAAIAPGQAAAFYQDNILLGGGIITAASIS